MALAKCRECGKRVSTEAVVCPHCGCPEPTASPEPAGDGSAHLLGATAEERCAPDFTHSVRAAPPPLAPLRPASWHLPRVWVGFLFVGAWFLAATSMGVLSALGHRVDSDSQRALAFSIGAAGFIYWLYCVYALHFAVAVETGFQHPVLPCMAVLGHVIPGYNVYWLFRWPNALADFGDERLGPSSMPRYWPGLVLLGGAALNRIGGAAGLAVWFILLMYLTSKVREALTPAAPPDLRAALMAADYVTADAVGDSSPDAEESLPRDTYSGTAVPGATEAAVVILVTAAASMAVGMYGGWGLVLCAGGLLWGRPWWRAATQLFAVLTGFLGAGVAARLPAPASAMVIPGILAAYTGVCALASSNRPTRRAVRVGVVLAAVGVAAILTGAVFLHLPAAQALAHPRVSVGGAVLESGTPSASATSESSDEAAELADFEKRMTRDISAIGNRYTRRVEALHPEALLAPATFSSQEAMDRAERRLTDVSAAVDEYERDVSAYFAAIGSRVQALPISESSRQQFLAGFRKAEPKTRDQWRRLFNTERRLVSAFRDVHAFMRRQRGHYKVDGSRLLFDNDAAAAEYNRLIQRGTSLITQEGKTPSDPQDNPDSAVQKP